MINEHVCVRIEFNSQRIIIIIGDTNMVTERTKKKYFESFTLPLTLHCCFTILHSATIINICFFSFRASTFLSMITLAKCK